MIAVQLLIVLILITAIPAANSQQGNLRGPKSATPKYFEPQQQFQGGIRSSIYGPITSSDTLWQISQNYRPNSSLSVYQVMQAIFELNPDAFEQQNINLLKNGSMLTMPSENYISGINRKQAQQKSELDSENLQTKTSKQPPIQTKNTTSLDQTRELIDKKLLAIDESQNRQFLAIREQFSESITSVQNILDENKRLFERLDKVNADIDDMRSEEQQKSLQMNQMGKSIEELLDKSRQDDAKKAAQLAQKNTSWFDSSIIIILLFTLPVLLALTAFAYWMIKRKSLAVLKPEDDIDDFSLDPISAEMDDLSDALSAELSGESNDDLDDDNFFDDLPDDVLSEELEEAFDEEVKSDIEEPLVEEFDDLGDEGLKEEFEVGAGVVEQDDLDSLFADDDETSTEVQDTDINSELGNVLVEDDEQNADVIESEEDDSLLAPIESEGEKIIDSVVIDEEPPEISIDELLDESIDKSVENPLIDDSEDINEDVLQNLDKEIALQNDELDSITGSLIDELEQIEQMSSMIPDDDDELPEGEGSQLDIQKLDDLREEIDELGEEDKDDEIEIDISEVLNETLQSAASEELAETEQLDESEEQVEADALSETESAVETEALVEPRATAESKESVESESESESAIEVEESVDSGATPEAEGIVEPEQATEAKESVGQESTVESKKSVEPEQATEAKESVGQESTAEAKKSVEPEQATELEESVDLESAAEAKKSVMPESTAESEASVEPESTADSEASVESELTAESEASVEPELTAESEASVEPELTAESEVSVEPDEITEAEDIVESEPQIVDNIDDEDLFDTELSLEKDFDVPANNDKTLDEDQLEKALEDFEKEELDDVLEDLTSNVSAPVSSLDDLKFSANDFVTKNQTSQSAPLPTLDDLETIEDFDDSELEHAFDEDFGEESLESSPNSRDDLDDLPGLGEWLDEDVVKPDDKQMETVEGKDVIEELEDLSFDEMLESIDFDNELSLAAGEEEDEEDTGLDINALLDESHQSKDLDTDEQDAEDFLDVESLLNDSVSAESGDEIDKALDLEFPLEPFVTEQDNLRMIDVDADEGLGAKLDLAHAYIEIGEKESAKELLDEILQKGNAEQVVEVKIILDSLDK
jgi:pilus assembly protein FimV